MDCIILSLQYVRPSPKPPFYHNIDRWIALGIVLGALGGLTYSHQVVVGIGFLGNLHYPIGNYISYASLYLAIVVLLSILGLAELPLKGKTRAAKLNRLLSTMASLFVIFTSFIFINPDYPITLRAFI